MRTPTRPQCGQLHHGRLSATAVVASESKSMAKNAATCTGSRSVPPLPFSPREQQLLDFKLRLEGKVFRVPKQRANDHLHADGFEYVRPGLAVGKTNNKRSTTKKGDAIKNLYSLIAMPTLTPLRTACGIGHAHIVQVEEIERAVFAATCFSLQV